MARREENPTYESVAKMAVDAGKAKLHTSMPGYVLAYDRELQKAKIQLIVRGRKRDPDSDLIENYLFTPLENVPVKWQSGSSGSITEDLEEGSVVMVHFAERSLDEWLATGELDTVPRDPRRHDLTDSWADPGLRSFAEPLGADAVAAGASVWRSEDIRLGSSSASDFVALSSLVQANQAKVSAWMGQVTTWLATHIHADPTSGFVAPSVLPTPTVPTLDSVAATKVKAE